VPHLKEEKEKKREGLNALLVKRERKQKRKKERKREERMRVFFKGFSNLRRSKLPISKVTSET
jgi:hypothetical protein